MPATEQYCLHLIYVIFNILCMPRRLAPNHTIPSAYTGATFTCISKHLLEASFQSNHFEIHGISMHVGDSLLPFYLY